MRARFGAWAPWLAGYGLIATALLLLLWVYAPVRVAGGSMSPALLPGDVVVVARGRTPDLGDIVLFGSGGGMVLHRVTKVLPNGGALTRGDANPIADFEPAEASSIMGTVVAVVPVGRLFERWRGLRACATLPAQTNTRRQ